MVLNVNKNWKLFSIVLNFGRKMHLSSGVLNIRNLGVTWIARVLNSLVPRMWYTLAGLSSTSLLMPPWRETATWNQLVHSWILLCLPELVMNRRVPTTARLERHQYYAPLRLEKWLSQHIHALARGYFIDMSRIERLTPVRFTQNLTLGRGRIITPLVHWEYNRKPWNSVVLDISNGRN